MRLRVRVAAQVQDWYSDCWFVDQREEVVNGGLICGEGSLGGKYVVGLWPHGYLRAMSREESG